MTDYLVQHRARFVAELQELVRFPSISAQPDHDGDVRACAQWLAEHLRSLGLKTVIHRTAAHPIITARAAGPRGAPTVLIYGHYDVQPPEPLEVWRTPPFGAVVQDGKLYGRGASDNKGQFFAHVKAVESFQAELPVGVIFLLEGEEETGSASLVELLSSHARQLRADYVVISDSGMYSARHPALTYATRGVVALEVRVDGPDRDLHSGVFGGSVANPAQVLAQLLADCMNAAGRVTVPGFYGGVRPLAAWERRAWRKLPFNERAYQRFLGVPALAGEAGYSVLERRWARPTFEINGLTAGYQGVGGKTIIPAWASAKITCRIVPDQRPAAVAAAVARHLRRSCPPTVRLTITEGHHAPPFLTNPDTAGGRAAQEALAEAFGRPVVLVREGGTLPVLEMFQRQLGGEVLLVGLGLPDDNWHSPNEKFDLANFEAGIAMSRALLRKLGVARRRAIR